MRTEVILPHFLDTLPQRWRSLRLNLTLERLLRHRLRVANSGDTSLNAFADWNLLAIHVVGRLNVQIGLCILDGVID
jgi:hypothetical protein